MLQVFIYISTSMFLVVFAFECPFSIDLFNNDSDRMSTAYTEIGLLW